MQFLSVGWRRMDDLIWKQLEPYIIISSHKHTRIKEAGTHCEVAQREPGLSLTSLNKKL